MRCSSRRASAKKWAQHALKRAKPWNERWPQSRVEWAFQPGVAGNARKQWASGQALRRCPFYAGFRAGVWRVLCVGCRSSVPVVGRNPASIGRLRVGWLEMPVNTGLAGRLVFCDAASATASLLSVTGIAIRQRLKKQYK